MCTKERNDIFLIRIEGRKWEQAPERRIDQEGSEMWVGILRPPIFKLWCGCNENRNRILLRFIPKGMDVVQLTVKELERIEDRVNNYLDWSHGYMTVNEMTTHRGYT